MGAEFGNQKISSVLTKNENELIHIFACAIIVFYQMGVGILGKTH
jgi:hypothetical protein